MEKEIAMSDAVKLLIEQFLAGRKLPGHVLDTYADELFELREAGMSIKKIIDVYLTPKRVSISIPGVWAWFESRTERKRLIEAGLPLPKVGRKKSKISKKEGGQAQVRKALISNNAINVGLPNFQDLENGFLVDKNFKIPKKDPEKWDVFERKEVLKQCAKQIKSMQKAGADSDKIISILIKKFGMNVHDSEIDVFLGN